MVNGNVEYDLNPTVDLLNLKGFSQDLSFTDTVNYRWNENLKSLEKWTPTVYSSKLAFIQSWLTECRAQDWPLNKPRFSFCRYLIVCITDRAKNTAKIVTKLQPRL